MYESFKHQEDAAKIMTPIWKTIRKSLLKTTRRR